MRILKFAALGLALLLPIAALAGRAPAQQPAGTPPAIRWGKANDANLKAMARPADLAAPAVSSPGVGRLEAAAIGRLLEGKVIDLKREGSAAGNSGSGGQP